MMASIILRRFDHNTRSYVDTPLIAVRSYELPDEPENPAMPDNVRRRYGNIVRRRKTQPIRDIRPDP
jgi:hypothetical protein